MAKQQLKQQTARVRSEDRETADNPQSGRGARTGTIEENTEADHVYGLASVLYHALKGASAARKYAADARSAGAEELVEFFEECRREGAARAKQAKFLLVEYSGDEGEDDEDDDDRDEDED